MKHILCFLLVWGLCSQTTHAQVMTNSHLEREFSFALVPVPPDQEKFLKVESLSFGGTEIEKNLEMELTVLSNHIHLTAPLYNKVLEGFNKLDPGNIHCQSVAREFVNGFLCQISRSAWNYLQKNSTEWGQNVPIKDKSFVVQVNKEIQIKVGIKELLKGCTIIHVGRLGFRYKLKSDIPGQGRVRAERVCYSRFFQSNKNMISTEFVNKKANAQYATKINQFIRVVQLPATKTAATATAPAHLKATEPNLIQATKEARSSRYHALTENGYPYVDDEPESDDNPGHSQGYFIITPLLLPGGGSALGFHPMTITVQSSTGPSTNGVRKPLGLPNKVTGMFFTQVESELEYFIQVLFGIDVMLLCIISGFMWNSRFDIARSGGMRALIN